MKKIKFGHSNEVAPTGSWEKLGIKDGIRLNEADYYGAISLGDKSYIVAKVVESKLNSCPQLLDRFIVREAVVDFRHDCSGSIFLDQEESIVTKKSGRILE